MRCPNCQCDKLKVKATRWAESPRCTIPNSVRFDIEENVGFVAPNGWVARWRYCLGCFCSWWTVEISLTTLNEVSYDNSPLEAGGPLGTS